MIDEKGFYDIISSKFEGREVPFNVEDWKSMRIKIDATRTGKRRTVLFIALLGLLLCAGGAITLYKWNGESGKQNTNLISSDVKGTSKGVMSKGGQTSVSIGTNSKMVACNNAHYSNLNNESIIKKQARTNKVNLKYAAADKSFHPKNLSLIEHTIKRRNQVVASGTAISSGNNKQMNIPTYKQVAINPVVTLPKPSLALPLITAKSNVAAAITVQKTDSAVTGDVLPPRFSDEPRIFRGKKDIFSVEAGAEYSGGWQIGSVVQGKGVNPIIGVGYAHYIGSNLFLKTGLQFSIFGNMSTLTYNYQHSSGNVIYDSVITTKRLYFLRIPAQIEYFIGYNKKSSVGLGGAAWFLMGNSGYATTYQQVDNNPPVNTIQYSQNAPLSGYAKVNASAYGLYRYNFTHNFSIYGILYYEMTSMKDNSFFGGNIIERTHGFQLMASYSFN